MYKEKLIELINKKISIISHGVDLDVFYPATKWDSNFDKLKDDKKFTFLFVGGWSRGEKDRKNLPALLRAYTKEFKKSDNVRLIVKINSVYNDPRTWNIKNEMDKLKINVTDSTPLMIITDMIPMDKLNQLYSLADVFVMPTRGEAFCLPNLEAMACGVPSITTNFGGQTDFVNESNGWLVDYTLKPACEESILYEEAEWAEIDEEDLRKKMRYVYENRKEVTKKSKKALEDAKKFTWENSASKLLKAIDGMPK